MTTLNEMKLEFKSQTANISFGRAAVAAFVSQLDPILSEVEDISTAVSEAITNAVVHGYKGDPNGIIRIIVRLLKEDEVEVIVEDFGVGIPDLEAAKKFGQTSQPEERIGIGFSLMEQCMDEVVVSASVPEEREGVKPSGFLAFLRRGLGRERKGAGGSRRSRPGTRVTMRKRLQRKPD
ncbi:MAG: anti-sigma F factor [bacterium]|jgi:stage II sporulation protein AB (anti-sigma F factor)|nr:anti-sigma F factor [Bacillota bacterium]HHW55560.1 anti-sigma F factor [Bacillota bacterium]